MNFISHFTKDREQSVLEHNLNVAKLTSEYASEIGFSNTGYLIGYLHDIGKYNEKWQKYIREAREHENNGDYEEWIKGKPVIDHGKVAGMFLFKHFLVKESTIRNAFVQILSMVITYHHGGLSDFITPNKCTELNTPLLNRINIDNDEDYESSIENFKDDNVENMNDPRLSNLQVGVSFPDR